MIDIAIKYKDELQKLHLNTWFQEKYKYYNYQSYYNMLQLNDDTWNHQEFVSLDKEGKVIGLIKYRVDRDTYSACGFGCVNFTDNHLIFGKDLFQVIKNIFEKFNFHKLSFCVVIGNPVEKAYDKLIVKCGGRIVGIEKQHTKLYDNKFYDVKNYEILREDYMKSKENNKCKD